MRSLRVGVDVLASACDDLHMVTTMQLHHSPEVVEADYQRSEALGAMLLDALGCLGSVVHPRPKRASFTPSMIRHARHVDLVSGKVTYSWDIETLPKVA